MRIRNRWGLLLALMFCMIILFPAVQAKSQDGAEVYDYERYAYRIVERLEGFLEERVNEAVSLSAHLDLRRPDRVRSRLESFASTHTGTIWMNLGTDEDPIEQYYQLPLYPQIQVLGVNGSVLVDYRSDDPRAFILDEQIPDVEMGRECFSGAEGLEEGHVWVGRPVSPYVSKKMVFEDVPQVYKGRYDKVIARNTHNKGGMCFSVPIYRNETFAGVVTLVLDYQHLLEQLRHIDTARRSPQVSVSYADNYVMLFDNEGSAIYHPKPDNLRGYLVNGSLASMNTENSADGGIFNLYHYQPSPSYRRMATQVLDQEVKYVSSAVDLSGRSKLVVAVPVDFDRPNVVYPGNKSVWAGLMLSLNVDRSDNLETADLRRTAKEVRQDIDEYLRVNPSSLQDLEESEMFRALVIRSIGREGYSFLISSSGKMLIHPDRSLAGLSLHELPTGNEGLEDMFARAMRGGCHDSFGTYSFMESDGVVRKKYAYLACSNEKTQDGAYVLLGVSVYVDNEEEDVSLFALRDRPYENISLILAAASLLLFLFFSLIPLRKDVSLMASTYYRIFTVSGIVFILHEIVQYLCQKEFMLVHVTRVGYLAGFLMVVSFFMLCVHQMGIRISRRTHFLLILYNGIFSLILLVTPLIVQRVDAIPDAVVSSLVVPGPLHLVMLLFILSYLMILLYLLLFRRRKKKNRGWHRLHLSEFILVLMILLFLSVATKMMLQSHSSLLFTTVIVSLLGGGFLILLFRTGFLRPRIYSFYIIGIVGVLFLLTLSATSTYYVMQGMEPASMEYYASTEHRQLQSGLWRFDQEMDDIIAQVSMAAESVDLYAVNDSQLIAENLQTILYSYRGRFLASVHLLAEDQRVMGELAERNSDTGSSHYSLPVDRSADEPRIVRVRHMSSAEVVADLVIPSQSPEIPSLNAVIPLDWVVQVVFLRAMDPEASILLVAPDGEVVYRSREVSSEQADAVSKAVSTAEGSVFAYDLKVDNRSVEHVIMSVSGEVLDQDWTVISLRPKSTVHSFFSAYGRRVWRYTALFMVSIIILAVFLFLLLTNALRHEVQRKTGQVANANRELEKRIVQRTEELENKSAELERLNISLQQQIESKTYELRKKLASEERSTKAMIYILERVKSASAELEENKKQIENKNKELNRQSEKLMQTNAELLATQQDLVREKQSVELKVAERTRQLSEQKEKVSHLLALKTAFVNQLSHDLRTPLSPLNVLLPMMQDQTDDPAMKKRLDVCIRNTRFLTDLVTKTLDLAHLDAGRVEFDFCRFDIAKMIREAIRSRHQDRDQRIRIRTKMPARCMAYGDPLRIQEVLDNIVENGRKSMQEDGTITIGLEKKEGDVVVWVRDQGIGMTQEVLDRMFDEFYKEDNSRHDLRSFGLGLTISKRIIQAHKGRIWAVSQGVGHGATFFFSIPRTLEGKRKKDSR